MGAGQQFKSNFRLACSAAVRSAAYTALRFERRGEVIEYVRQRYSD